MRLAATRFTRTALCAASAVLMAGTAACSSNGDGKTGMYVEITNSTSSEISMWGCPEQCGPLGIREMPGFMTGWNETRSGIAYTIALHGKQMACPPVIPQRAGSRGIYYFVHADGTCTVGQRPDGQTTPE